MRGVMRGVMREVMRGVMRRGDGRDYDEREETLKSNDMIIKGCITG